MLLGPGVAAAAAVAAGGGLASCAGIGGIGGAGGDAAMVFESTASPAVFAVRPVEAVYRPVDRNTADLYFTDIPGVGAPGSSGLGLTGSVVHVHLFLTPKAGSTPIDFTASNMTVTHVLLADGAFGVYSGAGFLLPNAPPGGRSLGGRVEDATLRPGGRAPGFAERLGWNELSGRLSATRDERRSAQLAAWLDAVLDDPRLGTPDP